MRRLLSVSLGLLTIFCGWPLVAQDKGGTLNILATLKGHTEPVYAVAFSPDGKLLGTASFDNTLKLWEVPSGKERKSFSGPTGHNKMVLCLAFSQDGHQLASGAADNTLKVWDVPSTSPLRSFANDGAVSALALSPDGTRLAVGGQDGIIKILSAGDFKQVHTLKGHAGPITGLSFNGNGKTLASSGVDGMLRYWNPDNGQLLATVGGHVGKANGIVLHPNNPLAFSAGDDGMLRQWQVPAPPARQLAVHGDTVNALALAPAGAGILSGSGDRSVRLSSLATGKEVRTFPGLDSAVSAVAMAMSGNTIAAGGANGKLILWNAGDGKVVAELPAHEGGVTGVSFHAQNKQILTAGKDGLLKVWPFPLPKDDPEPAILEAHPGGVHSVQFHANGGQALTCGADKTVKLWDLAKKEAVRSFGPFPETVRAAVFSRDFTLAGAAVGKQAKIWNLGDGKEIASLNHPAEVGSVAFNQDKTRVATGSSDKLTRLWDLAGRRILQLFPQTGPVEAVLLDAKGASIISAAGKTMQVDTASVVRVTPIGDRPVLALALNPPGTHALIGSADGQVKLWNLGNGQAERSFAAGNAGARAVAIAKNNQLAAVAAADQTIRLYSLTDGKELGAAKAGGEVRGLAFSPNNQALAAACADKTVRSWNVAFNPGQPLPPTFLQPLQDFAHDAPAADVAIAPDSATVFSASQDKTVRAWKLASPNPTRNFQHQNLVDAVAFQPGGKLLASGAHDGKIRLFDLTKNAQVREINAHPTANATMIYALAFTAEGKQLLSGSFDQSLKLWDVGNGNLVREFKAWKMKDFEKGHQEPVHAAAFSPDGKWLASGSGGVERGIKIWNAGDGAVVRDLENPAFKTTVPGFAPAAHPGTVYNLRFTPDGKRLVAAGDAPGGKGYLSIWDPHDGKLLFSETVNFGPIFGLAVSPDGELLALGTGPRGQASGMESNAYLVKMPK